jgi:MFS family permease
MAAGALPTTFTPSPAYRQSVAWLLMVVYTLNFMDRQVMSVLLPQIQKEFGIGDAAAGLLHGTAFALFYVTLALPIARWADKANRVSIIAVATVLWSAATAACGFARNFAELFLARVAVGVGEAGCSPAAYSLLSGYFPPEKRSGAMAIYGAGIPLGSAIGLAAGGLLAQSLGWRETFWIFGAPGLIVGAIVALYIREPARVVEPNAVNPGLGAVLRQLMSRRSFIHATFATSLLAFAGFGAGTWAPSFLVRSHGMSVGIIGLALAAITILGAVPATIFAGRIADRFVQRDRRYHMWLPAIAMIFAVPFSIAALAMPAGEIAAFGVTVPSSFVVVALILVPTAANATYVGPVLAAIQSMMPDNMRAMTIAIFLFVTNLIGLGAGPVAIGYLSDVLRASFGDDSLRWALLVTVLVNMWAVFHFVRAARYVDADLGKRA